MPHRLCPNCKAPGRVLEDPSKHAVAEYYHCEVCRQVWFYRKPDPDAPAVIDAIPRSPSTSPCPQCARSGQLLKASSLRSTVDYYRCEACGHVWSHKKSDPGDSAVAVIVRT